MIEPTQPFHIHIANVFNRTDGVVGVAVTVHDPEKLGEPFELMVSLDDAMQLASVIMAASLKGAEFQESMGGMTPDEIEHAITEMNKRMNAGLN